MNISRTEPSRTLLRRGPAPFALVALVALTAGSLLAVGPPTTTTSAGVVAELSGENEADESAGAEETTVQTDPADGAKLTRPARSLRVWFDRPPVVAESSLSLEGPAGALQVQGLHTMGEDDLMARVVGAMPDGTYEASYSATFADGASTSGSWSFEIQRTGQSAR